MRLSLSIATHLCLGEFMKKLTLLTLSLIASTVAYADIAVQISLKNNDQEITSNPVRLTTENPSAVFTFNETNKNQMVLDHNIKVVLKGEDPYQFDVFKIVDGVEELISSPEINLDGTTSGAITVAKDGEGFTLTIEHVE
jgi:hypothetical protein